MQVTPEDRACHEWACRIVYGFEAEEEVFVLRNLYIVWGDELETELVKLNPSGNSRDAVVATLAQMMKLHLHGLGFAELRNDLVRSSVSKQFAKRVYDHLMCVSVEEWARLRERITWYGHDNDAPITGSTSVQGES